MTGLKILLIYVSSSAVMSPKKSPDISKSSVELEIASLAGESSGSQTTEAQSLKEFLTDFQRNQDSLHAQLLKKLSESSQLANQAVISAINTAIPAHPQRSTVVPACPSQPCSPVDRQELYAPPDMMEVEDEWEEVEGEASVDDIEGDFEGWDLPASGRISTSPSEEVPPVNTQASSSTKPASPVLDDELFNMYGLSINWNLAPELILWLQSVRNKEVPFNILKKINESFVPKEELQPLFTAPALPQAISRLLFTAPKALSRGPKIMNTTLLRVQKELCVAYKPLLEVLNFFYSESCTFLIESVPEIKDRLATHKLQLSQTLAILISAALKVSKARKHALRPLLKYSSSNILQQQPTSQHVLGSDDLAALSDKANKEQKALYGVFRHAAQNRQRYRASFRPYSFNQRYQGTQRYNTSNYRNQENSYQGRNNYTRSKYPRNQSKRGRYNATTSK